MKDSNSNGDGMTLSLFKLAEEQPKDTLGYAQAYTDMGLPVIPNNGKRPLLKDWTSRRLIEEELPSCFKNGQNVGLLNGEASGGLVTVDLDVLEALKINERFLPQTVRSGRESTPVAHAWYRSPGAKTMKYQDVDRTVLLEIRSDGCQTLVPPSVHPNGECYLWDPNSGPEPVEVDANELERWCTELATVAVVARHLPPVGGRHEYAKPVIGFLMRRLEKEATLKIVKVAWHAAGDAGTDALRDLEGIANDIERRLIEGGNVFGRPTLEETVPGLPALLERWWGWDAEDGAGNVSVEDENIPTDDELRDRFSATNPYHAFGLGEWKFYADGVWHPIPEFLVKRRIVHVLVEAKLEGVRPTSGRLSSVHELARVELAVPDETWDADPDVLVCANGTLHIPTRELLPHSPEHYATGAVPYEYDENSVAPTWHRFLEDFVDAPTARFLQEFAGYALTTDVSHEIALWLCGAPGGGRSTFIMGLEAMLGQRAGTLGLGEIERSRFALADVPGKTLLSATEQPAGFMRASWVLNALISGDKLKVERKYKDAFDLYSKAKLLWGMNDVPRLPSANDGLFRRVKVVEIEPIPEGERDPG